MTGPGFAHPLGQVKILFPNDEDIYLHDTPEDQLFGEQRRGVSHGCIRLEKPFELAASLLGNWHEAEAALRAGETSRFCEVHPPVPVHLVYWTAWVDPNGTVHFREDVYRRDDPSTTVPVDKQPVGVRQAASSEPLGPHVQTGGVGIDQQLGPLLGLR